MAEQGKLNGRMHLLGWRAVVLFLFLAGTSVAVAQLPTATILGVVRDASDAVVPDVALTARNVETGQTRTTVSGGDGSYRFSALPVGTYEVRVEHSGFRSGVRQGLTLTVGQEAVVNFTLEVGGVEQTVSVTAEAPLVNTTSGSLGGLVNEQSMADLPLNGRNYVDLSLLQAGVSQQRAANIGKSFFSGTYFASNGATVRSNNYMLDGAMMVNMWGATSSSVNNSTLGVEGIREYRVITNSFSAEYGMTMGSQMTIVSKGGTNNFHGSLFEYLRNSALDARNFFDYKTAASERRLPAFIRNNFGGSFGGPIKSDKTLFHAVFEGVRERLGTTTISRVIPPSAKVDGGLVPQIAPVIKPLLALFPDPNLPGNQFTFPFTQPTTQNFGQVRVDQNFSNNDSLFVRYTIDDAEQTKKIEFPQFQHSPLNRQQFATLSETHVLSPTLLNTFRFSFSRVALTATDSPTEPSGPQISFVPGRLVGSISIGGVTGLGSFGQTPLSRRQNIFTYSNDVFYTRGLHSLKFGTLINHFQQRIETRGSSKGSASFPNITAFLLAKPSLIRVWGWPPADLFVRYFHYNTFGFYAQDDLRVRSNLTLNLGLRYEFNSVPMEQHGNWSHIHDMQHGDKVTISPELYQNPSLKNFSPRFGFAWDVRGDARTAVRGGFGLLYDIGQTAGIIISSMSGNPPFTEAVTASNPPNFTVPFTFQPGPLYVRPTDYFMQQPHMLQYNLTVERQLPFEMALTLAYAGSRGINLYQRKEGNPTIPQVQDGRQYWPVGAPRANPNFDTLDLYTAGANSWYNSLQLGLIKRLSKGLQFQSSYTWSKLIDELSGISGLEYGRSQSSGSDPVHREVDKGLAVADLTHVWKFNSIYRLPELTSSGGVLAKVLNGWWVSGILSVESGSPFTVGLSSNRSRSLVDGGSAVDRPDLVPGRNAANITRGTSAGCFGFPAGTPVGTASRYFDPCAFTIPAAGFLGTAGRNILRGPGFVNLDFSVAKDTALGFLGESGKLEFRAEFFNLPNRPNFQIPSKAVFAARADTEAPLANAGEITEVVGTSRQIQLALKIVF